uniref:Uncharacterized protein n=1 Tax=Anopheles merus TaxID=30066 RepID=A0A182VAC0_ANOME
MKVQETSNCIDTIGDFVPNELWSPIAAKPLSRCDGSDRLGGLSLFALCQCLPPHTEHEYRRASDGQTGWMDAMDAMDGSLRTGCNVGGHKSNNLKMTKRGIASSRTP